MTLAATSLATGQRREPARHNAIAQSKPKAVMKLAKSTQATFQASSVVAIEIQTTHDK